MRGLVAGELDDVLRLHRDLAELGGEAGLLQRFLDGGELPGPVMTSIEPSSLVTTSSAPASSAASISASSLVPGRTGAGRSA